ncbi:MAG TPA: DUF2721 domain-containing protein [Candidatus Baltobacteraceae bacterium]
MHPLLTPNPSPFLGVISAMITPAILILATGSLVMSTLTRVGRIVDRARRLIALLATQRASNDTEGAQTTVDWLFHYRRRAALAERALTLYYSAIGTFVAASLAISVDSLTRNSIPWLSLMFVVVGAIFLFSGTLALVIETNIATGALRKEIDALGLTESPRSKHG